tara:strand:+ start:330 stop:572 length:243 start_codon:yes stop_codon:yes gene_type:complete
MTIDFISAENGGLRLYDTDSARPEKGFWSDNVDFLAAVVRGGVAESVFGSSSMDFASEEGFDTDDGAMHLWKRALERAGI